MLLLPVGSLLLGLPGEQIGKVGQPQVLSMILLDAANTRYRSQAGPRKAVEGVLAQIPPEQRVAIYTLGSNLRTLHDFSADKESLLAKLRAYHGEITLNDGSLEDYRFFESIPLEIMMQPRQIRALNDRRRILDTLNAIP